MNIPSFPTKKDQLPGVSRKLLQIVIIMWAAAAAGIAWYVFG